MKNIFDILNALTETKEKIDFDDEVINKEYDSYMINRFISMCEVYLPFVNEINKHDNIPKENHFQYYLNILPQRKQYFNYIKKNKEINSNDLKVVAHYFEIGIKEAEKYIKIMSNEDLQEILNIYKYGKNQNIDI